MSLPSRVETVVIGAGQAGLAMSWFLGTGGRDHIVLERRATLGGGWQDRWDEFCLVSPNWTASFPGFPYDGTDPDGFMRRDEIAGRVSRYAGTIGAPVALETTATGLRPRSAGGFEVDTTGGSIRAETVVVATGGFHVPRVPQLAGELPDRIEQLHSHSYKRATSLPPGAVLVVGSAQSGVQIAEELHEAGRLVYLSVGSAGRVPRRYRGRDIFRWLGGLVTRGPELGVELPTVDKLPDRRLRLAGNPHLSGHGGGHDTNLREFGARGMRLLGRIERVDGERATIAPDLAVNLVRADRFFEERFREPIETFIERAGIDAPSDDRAEVSFDPPEIRELDLAAAGISSVIWATGYRLDFSWIRGLPIDDMGFPEHRRGVTGIPGLYFLGLLWQHNQTSATLFGPTQDGAYIAKQMGIAVPERTDDREEPVRS